MSESHGEPWQAPTGAKESSGRPGYEQPNDRPQGYEQPRSDEQAMGQEFPQGYGQRPSYAPPPNGQQPSYGQPTYGQQPDVYPQQPYAQQPSYGQQPAYGQQPTYGQSALGQVGYGSGYPVPARRTEYAHWGRRVGAFLIDQIPTYVGLIIFYVGYFQSLAEMVRSGSTTPRFSTGLVPMIIGTVIMLGGLGWTIYNRWIIAGRTGQSWGKRVMKIRLVSDQTGAPIGPLNAFLRDMVHTIDGLAFYIGYLWPLWDDKRQTFADKLMTTIIVSASPSGDRQNPAAR